MRYRGMTLIEVLAALALLGGLLTSAVLVHSRLQRNRYIAQQTLRGVDAAEGLLAGWHAKDSAWWRRGVPRRGGGEVPGYPGLTWTVQSRPLTDFEPDLAILNRDEIHKARIEIVTLWIWDSSPPRRGDGLVRVDLILPTPQSSMEQSIDTEIELGAFSGPGGNT